ncbi:hypothetical protein D1B31_10140 [Neobacillus notoginsengisoli]|uniref:YpoC-like domain-containing protein n=1 Tax=Neobacillus notoginsengisoli TaxID=1578198 RepID=A0A417YVF1_9BACI|nr:hypothetical protein [Neobacillus notoginsengisoli]RHW41281.1 hypothetical protein D1B31_10140 [Neobacillus notoginsengisoli]
MGELGKRDSIPSELEHPLFHELIRRNLPIQANDNQEGLFTHEILYFQQMTDGGPWAVAEDSVPPLLKEWEALKVDISSLFNTRNKEEILILMKKGIGLFLQLLYWSNGRPVVLAGLPDVSELSLQPINCQERLGFLLKRPDGFHSFIQLGELIEEQKKRFNTSIAKI